MQGTDRKCILQCIPRIFFELLMSELEFAVLFINTHDDDVNVLTHFRVFTRMIETFEPAQVADMDHTTDAGSQFNKHTVVGNVLHKTAMLASFRETGFNITPWISRKLLDR